MEFTPEEVGLYLEAVLGHEPVPDAKGVVRIRCPLPGLGYPPHDLLMNVRTGLWTDEGPHGRGDLVDFEQGRSRIFDNRAAENAVLKIIRETRERKRRAEEARKAARDKQVEDLPGSVRERVDCGQFTVCRTVSRDQPVRQQSRLFRLRRRQEGRVRVRSRRRTAEAV